MKVALVTTGQETLGVEYLSATLKKEGYDVKLFFDPQTFSGGIFLKVDFLQQKFDLSEKVVTKIIEYDPDIIGFSCMTHNFQWSLRIAKNIKKLKNIPIIFGGIHPTSVPDLVLENECVDMVAVGEGELSFLELLEKIEKGEKPSDIKGIYFKHNGNIINNPPYPLIQDLDKLSYPDKQLFYDKVPAFKKERYSIMTGRGCPFSCPYCCNDIMKQIYKGQRFIRRRSVDNVIAELQWAITNFNISKVYFIDEVFAFNLDWLEEFAVKYKEKINLPFLAYHHFKLCTEKHLQLLKKAGCYMLLFGMHSVSERIRHDVCNRLYSNQRAMEVIKLCKKYKFKIHCDQIFGLPFEREEDWAEAVDFYREVAPTMIFTFWLTYYPKTSIIDIGKEAGLLNDEDEVEILDGQQSYVYKGTAIKNRKTMLTYQLLFDLIPLLPKKMHKWISHQKWFLQTIPKGYIPHFILYTLTDILTRGGGDWLSIRRFKVAMSKKHVP